jgi:hypothetical protein
VGTQTKSGSERQTRSTPVASRIASGGSSVDEMPPSLNTMPGAYDKQYARVRVTK